MKRNTLISLAVLLSIAAVVLFLWTRTAPEASVSSAIGVVSASEVVGQDVPSPNAGRVLSRPDLAAAALSGEPAPMEEQPAEPSTQEQPGEPTMLPFREYRRADGIVVRDHRKNPTAEPDLTRAIARPESARKVAPEVIAAVREATRPLVSRCTDTIAAADLGQGATLRSDILFAIEREELRVERVTLHTRDVASAGDTALKSCLQASLESLRLPALGQPEIASHTVTLTFRLRR